MNKLLILSLVQFWQYECVLHNILKITQALWSASNVLMRLHNEKLIGILNSFDPTFQEETIPRRGSLNRAYANHIKLTLSDTE